MTENVHVHNHEFRWFSGFDIKWEGEGFYVLHYEFSLSRNARSKVYTKLHNMEEVEEAGREGYVLTWVEDEDTQKD